ncbi:serine/threonine protein kinase [Lysobacter sp. TY2-98]|uniref:serine/threonine-protein kinase n=1 Tax=Lysobacter sp. TY2-98 TaxID=2290922 RepID=UPI000E2060F1|nr:serine/threonine-protein kinase [Lysobacter sp. TY2-98]AXK71516.1 serine/threonine protein kinase [Lysobacter sp. TY2-98]
MSDATSTGLYAQMDLAPGTVLAGRFRIESLVGVGGMGVVYRAHDEALGVPVAIKLLRPEIAQRADAFERFRQELLLARQVSSPHVVRIHDIAKHEFANGETRWLISMDLIEGEPLDHVIDRGPLDIDAALRIARDVALGLQAAHARDVVHRDLKPANVLVAADGSASITDFGVARSIATSTRSATVGIVGTPDYLSPEQARGDPIGPRSDLYALGLILHEMLTGERAFATATAAEALAQRLVRSPPLVTSKRPDVPEWIARLVERLLRPQPAHRLPDAAAVVQAIDRREVPRDPVRRKRWLAGIAIVALVAAGGAFWWTHRAPVDHVAPAPSRPLERVLLMPLEGDAVAESERVGLDMRLRAALADAPGLAHVDTDRTLQALGQLDSAGRPSLDAMRRAGAASRVVRLELARVANAWHVVGEQEGGGDARIDGPHAPSPAAALTAWLRTPQASSTLGVTTAPALQLPASNVLALEGSAEVARRAGHYDAALAALRQSTTLDRDSAPGWLALADVAQSVGEDDVALNAVDRAQRASATSSHLRDRIAATRALLEGDGEAAAAIWRRLATQSPSDTHAELQLARALGAAGDLDAAVTTLQQLTGRDAQDARAWFELGKFSILKGDARRAVDDYLVRALVLFKRGRNAYGEAEAVNALGVGYGRLGQTAEAEEQYRHAVELRRAVGNRRGVATSQRNLANLLSQRGAFDAAAAALDEARRINVELNDRAGLAAVDNERGLLEEERGHYAASLDAFRLALQGYERAGDPHGVAQALNDIGFAQYQLGAYDDAQTYWQRASDAYRTLGDETGTIRTRQNLGLLHAARGRWAEAQQAQLDALAQARSRQMTEEAAVAYRNLAELAIARGDTAAALRNAAEATRLFKERDDLRGTVDAELLDADARIQAGDLDAASRVLDGLRANLAEASTEQRAIAGRLDAELADARGDNRAALAAVARAQPLATASGVRALQLELDLLQARLAHRDPAALDAPTASLGNAGLRLEWTDLAMRAALARRDAATALRLCRDVAPWLRGASSRTIASLHEQAAAAERMSGDEAAARDADTAARSARDRFAAARPASTAATKTP